jgi:hypothetical protein
MNKQRRTIFSLPLCWLLYVAKIRLCVAHYHRHVFSIGWCVWYVVHVHIPHSLTVHNMNVLLADVFFQTISTNDNTSLSVTHFDLLQHARDGARM